MIWLTTYPPLSIFLVIEWALIGAFIWNWYGYGQPNLHNLGSFPAAVLTGENHESVNDLLLLDVIPLSLGIENSDGEMCAIIKRNSTIPTSQTKSFSNHEDYQESVTVQVYEGNFSFVFSGLIFELWKETCPPTCFWKIWNSY